MCDVLELSDVSKSLNRLYDYERGSVVVDALGGKDNLGSDVAKRIINKNIHLDTIEGKFLNRLDDDEKGVGSIDTLGWKLIDVLNWNIFYIDLNV